MMLVVWNLVPFDCGVPSTVATTCLLTSGSGPQNIAQFCSLFNYSFKMKSQPTYSRSTVPSAMRVGINLKCVYANRSSGLSLRKSKHQRFVILFKQVLKYMKQIIGCVQIENLTFIDASLLEK